MCVCVCSSVLALGQAASQTRSGAPHLFLRLLCISASLGPLWAGVAPLLVLCLLTPPFSFFPFSVVVFRASPLSPAFFGFGPGCAGPWRCVLFVLSFWLSLRSRFFCVARLAVSCSLVFPPEFVSRGFCCRLSVRCFFGFFLSSVPPLSLAFSGFPPWVPWALALCLLFFFSCLPLLGSLCALACFVPPAWPLAASPHPPLPFCVSPSSALLLSALFLFSLLSAPPLSLAFSRFRLRVPRALALCCVCSARLTVRSRLVCVSRLAVGCSLVVAAPPFCLVVFVAAVRYGFFFSSCLRPRCLSLSLVSGSGCPASWRCVLFVLWASRFSALCALAPRFCVPPGRWLLPGACPPPFCVSRLSSPPLSVPFFFPCAVRPRCLRLSLASGPGCPGPRHCALIALVAFRFPTLRALSPLSCFSPGR